VVKGIIELTHHPDANGKIFNIGTTEEITIENLANLVKTITKSNSKIVHIPYDEAYEEGFEDMRRRVPDISRIQKLTGYKPTYDVKEIIKSVVEFYRNK
jgi:UDP-glucose 4-epimerase